MIFIVITERKEVNHLETIRRKDQELIASSDRYKKCVEKAKDVIKTMDPKQSVEAAADVAALRSQLQDKDKIIEDLEVRVTCTI